MEEPFKIAIVEKCWKESLNWTFELIDILSDATNGNRKIMDLEESKNILRSAKEKIEGDKKLITSLFDQIVIHVKPVLNFKSSLEKHLNSTEINFSKSMMTPPKPFDLFDSINNQELTEFYLNQYIQMVKKNLEINWIAFNQSYGRMIVKMKLNNYRIE